MTSPLTSNNSDTSTSSTIPSRVNTTQPLAPNTDAMRPQSYFKSTVQYSSAIALGQVIYILSVFLSLAQFAVTHAQVMLSQDQKRLMENTSPEKALSSHGAVTDKDKSSPSPSSSTTVTTSIIRERYSSRIKRALVKTLSGNLAPVALKRVTFDDEAVVEGRSEDRLRPKRISEEGTFAASPTAASPPTSPTGPGFLGRNRGLTHQQTSPAQPLTKKLGQIQTQQRTQPKIEKANATTTTTTTTTKKPSLPIFSLSSKSTTPSIAGGLRGINTFGSLGVAPETKSNTTVASVSSITKKNNNNNEEHGLRRSTSAPSKNSLPLRKNMERESVPPSTVAPTEKFIQEAPVEVSERMTFSFLVTETLVPDVIVSAHSPALAPTSRPDTPSLFEAPGSIDVMAKEEPPTSRNSLSVTSIGTRARRSLSLVRSRPSSILGEEDRKELEERSRRRSSVQLERPPDFVTTPSLLGGSAMERQASGGKTAGKSFLYKIAHPQRYKREQQEMMQKRSLPPSPPLANREVQTQEEQASIKEKVVVDDSSSIRSLPSSSPPPAPQQQPRPATTQSQPQATHFPSWPEYVDHLDSSETVHSALYFPLSQPVTHAPDSSLVAMPPLPSSARSSLLRRSRIFMDKADEDDHTSFAAFGHPSPSLTASETVSRPSFFTRSSSAASSEVSTLATTPSTSPRSSLSVHSSRTIVSSGSSSGKAASFGIAAALAGTTGVSTAMAGVARPDDRKGLDDSASEHSVASSMQSGDELRGRSGFVKKLGKK